MNNSVKWVLLFLLYTTRNKWHRKKQVNYIMLTQVLSLRMKDNTTPYSCVSAGNKHNSHFKPFSKQAPRKPGSQAVIHPSWLTHRLTECSSTLTSGPLSHSHSFLTKPRLWYRKLCPVASSEKITLKLPNFSLKTGEYPPQMFTL